MDNGADCYRRFLDGDDNALGEIIEAYRDGLILFLNRYVDSLQAAEEVAQDTFVRLATRRPRFSADASFKTWLYTIGRNLAINYMKRAGRSASTAELDSLPSDPETPEQSYLREEQNQEVRHALSLLRPDYQRVLYLKFFENFNNQQIADVMKKSKRQIENLNYQAKQALRTELEKKGFFRDERRSGALRYFEFGTAPCQGAMIRYDLPVETLANETETYGVRVTYQDQSVYLPAITTSQQEIVALLEALRRGSVTPSTTYDVVEDWLLGGGREDM